VTHDGIQQALFDILSKLEDEPMARAAAATLLDKATALLQSAPFRVVVCGEFEMGKSSLLSAMVSRPNIFPHHPNDTTGVITTLAWRSEPGARVVRSTEGETVESTVPLQDVQRYVTTRASGPTPEGGQVVLVEMRAPIERLRSGVVLVDTPGLNSTNPAHNVITTQFLANADVVLFVTAVRAPLSTAQLTALHAAVASTRNLINVVTKADLEDATPFVDAARKRIAEELHRQESDLIVLPVSAWMARRADKAQSREGRAESRVDDVWREVGRLHDRWTAARTATAAANIAEALETLTVPLRARHADVGSLLEQIQHIQQLRVDAPDIIRREVTAAIATIRDDARRQFDDLHTAVTAQTTLFSSYLDPGRYVENFLQAVVEVRASTDEALALVQERLVHDWSQRTEIAIALAPPDERRGPLDPAGLLQNRSERPPLTISALREVAGTGKLLAATGGGIGGGIGGIIGGIIGGVIAPGIGIGIGALLGQLVGWIAGLRDVLSAARVKWKTQQVHELSAMSPGWATQFASQEESWLARSATRLTMDLQNQLDTGLTELDALLQQALRAHGADLQSAARDAGWLAELEGLRAELDRTIEAWPG
jgi:ribosome biogenesis GTPase A